MKIALALSLMCLLACSAGEATTSHRSAAVDASDATSDARPIEAAAGPCTVSTSGYDESCQADTDCVTVETGDYCGGCQCRTGILSASAVVQFNEAASKTPVGSGAVRGGVCPCGTSSTPCCRAGQCTTDCSSPSDTLSACTDAGGICEFMGNCVVQGPANACARADESCCLPFPVVVRDL